MQNPYRYPLKTRAHQLIRFGLSALLFVGTTQAVTADADQRLPDSHQTNYHYDAHDPEFRRAHPFRVFVALEAGLHGTRSGPDIDNEREATIADSLRASLPSGVLLVRSPHRADMVLRAEEVRFDVDFNEVRREKRTVKYKKERRPYSTCGSPKYAHYTRVSEQAVANYEFNLRLRVKGDGRGQDYLRGNSSVAYQYGTDLAAATPCGLTPTDQSPTKRVARLIERSDPSYQRFIGRKVRAESALRAGYQLADVIAAKAYTHWERLAAHLNHNQERYGYHDSLYDPNSAYKSKRYKGDYKHGDLYIHH